MSIATVRRGRPYCQLLLPFFGLSPEYRSLLFQQLHDIVFFGRGGYDWHTAYSMPIWLRKFTVKMIEQRINEEHTAQKKAIEKSQGVQTATAENTRNVQLQYHCC